MNTNNNFMDVFHTEAPEVAQSFGNLIHTVAQMPALDPRMKQLIYIAIRASQGEKPPP